MLRILRFYILLIVIVSCDSVLFMYIYPPKKEYKVVLYCNFKTKR